MKTLILFLSALVLSFNGLSQGDDCFSAFSLGTLPAPTPCSGLTGGTGVPFPYAGTTVGAVAENPYNSLTCMDAPAADVWISFVASANEMDLVFTSGLINANIGIYTGTCGNLTGLFCETSATGNISVLLQPFTPGQTYYMQISGVDEFDFSAFNLTLTNQMNCALCAQDGVITATPAPVNGTYLPGQTVTFCATVDNYVQVSSNWMHAMIPSFGSGWNPATLTPVSAPGPSFMVATGYEWFWMTVPGIGTGYFVDEDDWIFGFDGDPTNNFGYPDLGPYTWCFQITTDPICAAGASLDVTINTTADGETGSWTSVACVADADIPFTAVMACCDVPLTSSIPTTCAGGSDGQLTVQGQAGVGPYDYVWEDPSATIIFTDINNAGISSMTGLAAGLYTVTVTDALGCVQIIDVEVFDGPLCPCNFTYIDALIGPCEPTNTFTVSGDFTYDGNPGTGTLVVEITNGSGTYSQTFFPPFVDAFLYSYLISGIPSDGSPLTITAYFTDDLTCNAVITGTSQPSCACNVDVGTFGVATNGTQTGNDFILCFGDDLDITSNLDATYAAEAITVPAGPPYLPGVSWLVYSCPPTVAVVPDPIDDVDDDPCYVGVVSDFDLNETNDMWWITNFPGVFTDNTVYFVPITMYSLPGLTYSYTSTTMPCYEMGSVYSVQYIPEIIEVLTIQDCATGTVTTTVSGGTPSLDGSLFTGTNLLPATLSFATGTALDGGNIVITGLVDGDAYSFDIVDVNGCPISISGTYTTLEDASFTYPSTQYCANEPNPLPVITGTPGGTFSSAPGISLTAATGLINLGASTPGTYTITYQTPDPVCFGTATFDVTIDPIPTVDGNDEIICPGEPVTLNGTGADTYTWNLGVINGVPFNPAVTATYTVIGTITATGCQNAGNATVTVSALPNVFAGNDFTVCNGNLATLSGSGASTYVWTGGVVNGVAFTPAATATYTVTGTDANGCVNTDNITVTVEPMPTVSFTADVLSGCAPLQVTFTNTTAGAMVDCDWSFGNGATLSGCGSVTTTFNTAGTYDVSLTTTSANGCSATTTYLAYINVVATPNASFTPSETSIDNFDPEVYFQNTSSGATSYEWDFGDGSGVTSVVSPTHSFPDDATAIYTVELVAYSQGCTDTAWATIELTEEVIFYVPNTFTPDDDDFNPTFQPIFTSGYDPYDFILLIFNRWGEVVFESHNAAVGWDGTYNGKLVQDGVYTWTIEFKTTATDERKLVTGHVSILR